MVYVDCNNEDFGMDPVDLEEKIKQFGSNGFIIPVHIGGLISRKIYDIVEVGMKYKMPVIEDCAHAHGSVLDGKHAGTFGDVGTFSFFLTKTLTSGEGGLLVTNNEEIYSKARMIRNYGKDASGLHVIHGSSWRMNEFTAAITLTQLRHQSQIVSEKKHIASFYDGYFSKTSNGNELYTIYNNGEMNGYYKYILGVNSNVNLGRIEKEIKEKFNIYLPARVYDRLCNEEPFLINHERILNTKEEFTTAGYLKEHHLCLPIYRGLSTTEVEFICDSIHKTIEGSEL